MRHAVGGSAAAASVSFIAYLVIYGDLIGLFAAPIAAMVTFVSAMLLAGFFLHMRFEISGPAYFCLHVLVGVLIGATAAKRNPHIVDWHQYLYNRTTLTVLCPSLAAWLYVAFFLPARNLRRSFAAAHPGVTLVVMTLAIPAMAASIVAAPVPADPSCHNVFRGGRLSARAALNVGLRLKKGESTKLRAIYDDFARDFGLSVRRHRGHRSICNDDVLIEGSAVNGQRGYSLLVYPHEARDGWQPLVQELDCRLRMRWEDSMDYTGDKSLEIARPEFLAESCPKRRGPSAALEKL
jgi:hypothetical protein